MVFADFFTETRRKWLQAFKLFKSKKGRKSARNRVSPAQEHSPSMSGTVDARPEIDVQRFCPCRASPSQGHESYENASYYSSCSDSQHSLHSGSGRRSARSDSAYDSDARSSPARARPLCYATVTYFNVTDDDSSSIHTEYTLLDCDPDAEERQNIINESIELVSTL